MSLEQVVEECRELARRRHESGYDQVALDEAARQGFANGAFEELDEDVPAVVEEFYPEVAGEMAGDVPPGKMSLGSRL
ncbi:hypothetical protein [Stenotrophomonas maltophilia]|uniref:hypothetical protein n=1 Tax=Stenotrophomonas maltophilia TaxID=40324 RepID=UPI001954597C|nr:hypothetical protein [Stenotrophomonas maltophilia]